MHGSLDEYEWTAYEHIRWALDNLTEDQQQGTVGSLLKLAQKELEGRACHAGE